MSEEKKVAKSVSVISFATMTSRVLGYIRDGLFAGLFGAGFVSDAFLVAYRIPNLLRDLLAEGALSSAFIPVFTEYLTKDKKEDAWKLVNLIFNTLLVILSLVVIAGIIFAPYIVHILQWNIPREAFELTVQLTRTVFPFIAFMALAALMMGVLNSHRVFFISAFAPALFNVVMIVSGIFICPLFGKLPEQQVLGWAIGALMGGLVQFAVQIPFVVKKGWIYKPVLDFADKGVRRIFRLLTPAIFAQSVTQINIIVVNTIMAGLLGKAAITYLYYGNRLMQLPLGVFAVAIATVTLPLISRNIAKGDMNEAIKSYSFALRLAFFITIPATIGMIVLTYPINSLLFEYGRFQASDAQASAQTAVLFSLGLFAFSGVKISTPIFYALNDSKTPVRIGMITVLLNVILGFLFMQYISYFGLALSTTCAAIINFFLQIWFLRKKMGRIDATAILGSVVKISAGSLIMGIVCYASFKFIGSVHYFDAFNEKVHLVFVVFGSIFISLIAYLSACKMLRVKELSLIIEMVFKNKSEKTQIADIEHDN